MRGDILPWRGTVCPSVDCPGGGGGGGGDITLVQNILSGGTLYTSAKRPGGEILGGTLYTMTPVPLSIFLVIASLDHRAVTYFVQHRLSDLNQTSDKNILRLQPLITIT